MGRWRIERGVRGWIMDVHAARAAEMWLASLACSLRAALGRRLGPPQSGAQERERERERWSGGFSYSGG
jgi:hypothetical protein